MIADKGKLWLREAELQGIAAIRSSQPVVIPDPSIEIT